MSLIDRRLDQPPMPSHASSESPEAAYRRGYHEALAAAVAAMERAGCGREIRNVFSDWAEQARRWKLRAGGYRSKGDATDLRPATGVERLERISRQKAEDGPRLRQAR